MYYFQWPAAYLWTCEGRIHIHRDCSTILNYWGQCQTLWPPIQRPTMAHLQVPEQIPSLTGPLWSLQSFQDKEKSKQTNTNHIQEEAVNKHLSPQVKLKPMPPCSTATSDRHAEGRAPNDTDRAAQWRIVPPRFQNSSTQSTRRPPLTLKRKWLFTIGQLYFPL